MDISEDIVKAYLSSKYCFHFLEPLRLAVIAYYYTSTLRNSNFTTLAVGSKFLIRKN